MRDLTGIRDVDDVIYDYIYGSRKPDRLQSYDKLVNEFNEIMDEYYEDIATQENQYRSFKGDIHKYIKNITFHEIFEIIPSSRRLATFMDPLVGYSPYTYGYKQKSSTIYTFDDNMDIILLNDAPLDKNEVVYLYER